MGYFNKLAKNLRSKSSKNIVDSSVQKAHEDNEEDLEDEEQKLHDNEETKFEDQEINLADDEQRFSNDENTLNDGDDDALLPSSCEGKLADEVTPREIGDEAPSPTGASNNADVAISDTTNESEDAKRNSINEFQKRKSNTDTVLQVKPARDKEEDDDDKDLENKVTLLQSQIRRRQAQHQKRVVMGKKEAVKFPDKIWVRVRDIGGGVFYFWPSTGAISSKPPMLSEGSHHSDSGVLREEEQEQEQGEQQDNFDQGVDDDLFEEHELSASFTHGVGLDARRSHLLASPVNGSHASRESMFLFGGDELEIGDDFLLGDDAEGLVSSVDLAMITSPISPASDEMQISPVHGGMTGHAHEHVADKEHNGEYDYTDMTAHVNNGQQLKIQEEKSKSSSEAASANIDDDEHLSNDSSHDDMPDIQIEEGAEIECKYERIDPETNSHNAENIARDDEMGGRKVNKPTRSIEENEKKRSKAAEQQSNLALESPRAFATADSELKAAGTKPDQHLNEIYVSSSAAAAVQAASPSSLHSAAVLPLHRIIVESAATRREKKPAMIVRLDAAQEGKQANTLEAVKEQLAVKMGLTSPSDIAELVLQPYNAVVEHAWELQNGDQVLVRTYQDILNDRTANNNRNNQDKNNYTCSRHDNKDGDISPPRTNDSKEHKHQTHEQLNRNNNNNNIIASSNGNQQDEFVDSVEKEDEVNMNTVVGDEEDDDPSTTVVLTCPQPCPVPSYVTTIVYDVLKKFISPNKANTSSSSSSKTEGDGYQCFNAIKAQALVLQLRSHAIPGRSIQLGTFIRLLRSIEVTTGSSNLRMLFDAIDVNDEGALTLPELEFTLYIWQNSVIEHKYHHTQHEQQRDAKTQLRGISGVHAAASTLALPINAQQQPFCSTAQPISSHHLFRLRKPKLVVERLTRARDGAPAGLHNLHNNIRPKSVPSHRVTLLSLRQQQQQQQYPQLSATEPLQVPAQLGQYELEEWLRGQVLSSHSKPYKRAEALVLLSEFLIQSDDAALLEAGDALLDESSWDARSNTSSAAALSDRGSENDDGDIPKAGRIRAVAAWEKAKSNLLEARKVIEKLINTEIKRNDCSKCNTDTKGHVLSVSMNVNFNIQQDALDYDDRVCSQAARLESMRVRIAALLARVFEQLSEPAKANLMLAETTKPSSSSSSNPSSFSSMNGNKNSRINGRTKVSILTQQSINSEATFAIAQHALTRSASLLRRAKDAQSPPDWNELFRFDAIAFDNLLDAIAMHPQHTPALLSFAQLLQERGDTLNARIYFRRAAGLSSAPGSSISDTDYITRLPVAHKQARVTAMHMYALLLSDKGEDHVQATNLLKQCVRMDVMNADALYSLGRITCQKLGKPADSVKWFRKAISAQPRHSSAMLALAQVLGQPNASAKTLQEAETMYRGAMSVLAELIDPSQSSNSISSQNTVGMGELRTKLQSVLQAFAKFMQVVRGDDAEARRLLEMAHQVDPSQAAATQSLGLFLQDKGMHDKAALVFKRAVKKDPRNTSAYVGLARSMVARGNTARARESLLQALALDSNSGDALWALAELDKQAGRIDQARTYFERACGQAVRSPADFNAAYGSFLFESLGHVEKATERLRAALRVDNDHGPALCAYAWMTYIVDDDVSSAVRMLRRAVRSDPHHVLSMLRLAELLALPFIHGRRFMAAEISQQQQRGRRGQREDDLASASELLKSALRQTPDDVSVLMQSAMVQAVSARRGDLGRAVKQLKRARRLAPNDGEVHYILGVVLQQRAAEQLSRARRLRLRNTKKSRRRQEGQQQEEGEQDERDAADSLHESVDSLKCAIRLEPGHVLAMHFLATQAEAMDQLKLTQRVLMAALNVDPGNTPQENDFEVFLKRLRVAYYRSQRAFLRSSSSSVNSNTTSNNTDKHILASSSIRRALVVHQRVQKRASTMALSAKHAIRDGGAGTGTGGGGWEEDDSKEARFLRAFRKAAP